MYNRLEKLTAKKALQLVANHQLAYEIRNLWDSADYYLVDLRGSKAVEVAPHNMDECGTFLTI